MSYHIKCRCGQSLVVSEDHIGSELRCPQCAQFVAIPSPAHVTPPPSIPPLIDGPDPDSLPPLPLIQPVSRQRLEQATQRKRDLNSVYWLAVAMVLVTLVSITPLLLIVTRPGQRLEAVQLEPWAFAIIFSAILQCAYLIYLVQIPDWSTMRVLSIVTLLHATAYAMLAGTRILAPAGNALMRLMGLEDGGFTTGQQAGWCLIMLLLYGVTCYLAGHLAGKWRGRVVGC